MLPNLHLNERSDEAAHCYSSMLLEAAYFMFSAHICHVNHCREGVGCERQQLKKQKAEGRNHSWPLSFLIRGLIKVPSRCLQGLSLLLAHSLPVPLAERALQGQLCPGTKDKTGSCESAHRLTTAHCSSLFFQSCLICRPDSLALPGHTTQPDSDAVICCFYSGHHCSNVSFPLFISHTTELLLTLSVFRPSYHCF